MIIPYFSFHTTKGKNITPTQKTVTPKVGKPNSTVKFWYVDRSFIYRFVWEDLKENNNSSTNITRSIANQININNIQECIDANTVEIDEPPAAVTIPRRPAADFQNSDD